MFTRFLVTSMIPVNVCVFSSFWIFYTCCALFSITNRKNTLLKKQAWSVHGY